jgi:hypothetical protein
MSAASRLGGIFAGRAPYAGGGHFVTCVGLRVVLPMVAVKFRADPWRDRAKRQNGA